MLSLALIYAFDKPRFHAPHEYALNPTKVEYVLACGCYTPT